MSRLGTLALYVLVVGSGLALVFWLCVAAAYAGSFLGLWVAGWR